MRKEANAKAGLPSAPRAGLRPARPPRWTRKLRAARRFLESKVLKFIEHLTLDRGDPPHAQLAFGTAQAHLALNEMTERKHRNDTARKGEFDMLRKIRRTRKGQNNPLTLLSSYLSSQLTQDSEKSRSEQKRQRTLRQIDEIEAQLSSSWFRNEPGDPPTAPMFEDWPSQPAPAATPSQNRVSIAASDWAGATGPAGMGILGQRRRHRLSGASTPPSLPPELDAEPAPPPDQPEPPVLTHPYQPRAERNRAGASSLPPAVPAPQFQSSSQPVQPSAPRQDPEIEAAAISFASGDPAAAESTLLKLIGAGSRRRQEVEVWLALFDLYRVTGKSAAFDDLASEFTTRFGRPAPQWERAQEQGLSGKNNTAPQTGRRQGTFAWISPAQFNAPALAALTRATQRSVPPWRIDWRSLSTIEPDVLPQLDALFTQWADTPTSLQFLGGEQLLAVLAEQSPTEDKSVNPVWWRARLALLRLMDEPDRFDQTALDYCITYEISPPAWVAPKSRYTPLTADG